MLNIQKGAEPTQFRDWKEEMKGKYDLKNYPENYDKIFFKGVKPALQEGLCKEQGYICCYCMQRIEPTGTKMHVEHFRSQDSFKEDKYEYSNMLAACCGNSNIKGAEKHCDASKAEGVLKYNPSDSSSDIEVLISYDPDGTIRSSDGEFDSQLNSVLNLNAAFLKNNRKAVKNAIVKHFKTSGEWTKIQIDKVIRSYSDRNSRGQLKPYCGVATYYLKQRRARA